MGGGPRWYSPPMADEPEDPFNPTTPEDIRARLASLDEKLKAREGNPLFEKNCVAIREEKARLEGELAKLIAAEEAALAAPDDAPPSASGEAVAEAAKPAEPPSE